MKSGLIEAICEGDDQNRKIQSGLGLQISFPSLSDATGAKQIFLTVNLTLKTAG
jgi:hypothetical protein